jgi:hypothetical protein
VRALLEDRAEVDRRRKELEKEYGEREKRLFDL